MGIAPKQTRNTTKISVSDHFLHIFQDLNSKVKCLLSILVSSRNYWGTSISVQTPFQTGVLAFANKVFCSIGQPVGPSISGQSQSGKSFHGGFQNSSLKWRIKCLKLTMPSLQKRRKFHPWRSHLTRRHLCFPCCTPK